MVILGSGHLLDFPSLGIDHKNNVGDRFKQGFHLAIGQFQLLGDRLFSGLFLP